MKIDFANLQLQYQHYKDDIDLAIHAVLDASNYVMGEQVAQLELAFQSLTNAEHVTACSSGTDALLLAMMALDIQPGDEIITTPFTFIATAETIALMKAVPVFVDVEEDTFNMDASKIEGAITEKTKVIMPVSLYGQPPDMDEINAIAHRHGLKVILDGAQSFGSTYKGQSEVHHCDIYTTSFFPAKPLGCYGDGGAVFTNNGSLAEKMQMLRVHGQNKRYHHKYIGMGGRLDTLQAAILLAKLPHYPKEMQLRQSVSNMYGSYLEGIVTPKIRQDRTSVWAQYTVRVEGRDQVQQKLKEAGIPTAVHYPMPLHRQVCFQYLGYKDGSFPVSEQASKEVLSLPMNPFLTEPEVSFVAECLKQTSI